MRLNFRGLAGTCAVAAAVGLAGCVTNVNTPGTPSPRPSASAGTGTAGTASPSPATGMSPGTGASAAPAAFTCDTPAAVALVAGNTDFDMAQEVSPCSQVTGAMVGDASRYFKVMIPAGPYDGRLKVTLEESNASFIPYVTFHDSMKATHTSSGAADGTATPLVVSQDVTAGKLYYVVVTQPEASTQVKVKFEFMPTVDTHERNDTPETAKMLTSGQPVNLIHFAGIDTMGGDDVDYFKIDVPAGKTKVNVKVMNKSTAAEPQIWYAELFDSSKASINSASSANNQADLTGDFSVEKPGTYTLKLNATTNSPVASQLTVTVQ